MSGTGDGILNFIRRLRWRRPSETRDEANCVILDAEVDLPADAVKWLGISLLFLQRLDPNVDTDHPIFRYMGEQQEAGLESRITVTVAITRRDAKHGPG